MPDEGMPGGFDFLWIVKAAGDDQRKLAEVAILLAGFSMLRRSMDSPEEHAQIRRDMVQVTYAMDEIGKRMGIPPSSIMAEFRDIARKEEH